MGARIRTDIDVERVWQLYQVKGTSMNDIAFSLQTKPEEIRAALAVHARRERKKAIQQAIESRQVNAERKLFELTLPELAQDENAWKVWLARSTLKTR
jgi:hypothetical protein